MRQYSTVSSSERAQTTRAEGGGRCMTTRVGVRTGAWFCSGFVLRPHAGREGRAHEPEGSTVVTRLSARAVLCAASWRPSPTTAPWRTRWKARHRRTGSPLRRRSTNAHPPKARSNEAAVRVRSCRNQSSSALSRRCGRRVLGVFASGETSSSPRGAQGRLGFRSVTVDARAGAEADG